MRTRKVTAECIYNNTPITEDIQSDLEQVSYDDPASGESDSYSVSVDAQDDKWLGPWMPDKGSSLTCSIAVEDWEAEGDDKTLACGKFLVDDISFAGPPTVLSIKGVSSPVNQAFSATERTQNWQNVTLHQVAQAIATRSGVGLVYDAAEITIATLEQDKQTDSAFLSDLAEKYGLSMKVYMDRIVLFDREAYKQKGAVGTIDKSECKSWSAGTDIAGTYTGGQLVYTDSDKGTDIGCQIGGGDRLLNLNQKVDSFADAGLQLAAALNNANHGETTIQITRMGSTKYVAGQCVSLTGWGKFDGKYYVDEATHTITKSDGYTCDYKLILCMPPFRASDAKPINPSGAGMFVSDTTMPVTKAVGQTYQVKITAMSNTDAFAAHVDNTKIASISLALDRVENGKRTYYYKAKALSAGRTGVFVSVNGTSYHVYDLIVTAAVGKAAAAAPSTGAGKALSLKNCPLYASSTAGSKAATVSGTYYLYDGQNVSGRYRITNSPSRCGKTPVGSNVTGWIAASDVK
jgi:phage protein D